MQDLIPQNLKKQLPWHPSHLWLPAVAPPAGPEDLRRRQQAGSSRAAAAEFGSSLGSVEDQQGPASFIRPVTVWKVMQKVPVAYRRKTTYSREVKGQGQGRGDTKGGTSIPAGCRCCPLKVSLLFCLWFITSALNDSNDSLTILQQLSSLFQLHSGWIRNLLATCEMEASSAEENLHLKSNI